MGARCCISMAGLMLPGGVGENEDLILEEGVAMVFEAAGEELIDGRVGVGSAVVLTTVVGDGALRG